MTDMAQDLVPADQDAQQASEQDVQEVSEKAEQEAKKLRERASVLRKYIGDLPANISDDLSVSREHQALLDDWEYVDIESEDENSLVKWVRKASQFVNFVIQSKKSKKKKYRQLIDDIEDVPSVNANWHYPWIAGWDDPNQRKALIKEGKSQQRPEGLGFGVKVAIGGAAAAAALYMMTRES